MKLALCIGLGGFVGALARHYLALWLDRLHGHEHFPFGILYANVIGCLVIGMVFGVAEHIRDLSDPVRLFLVTGFLGSLTTFSTFGYNTVELLRKGQMLAGLTNIGASLVLGLTAVWLGYQVAHWGSKLI